MFPSLGDFVRARRQTNTVNNMDDQFSGRDILDANSLHRHATLSESTEYSWE